MVSQIGSLKIRPVCTFWPPARIISTKGGVCTFKTRLSLFPEVSPEVARCKEI